MSPFVFIVIAVCLWVYGRVQFNIGYDMGIRTKMSIVIEEHKKKKGDE